MSIMKSKDKLAEGFKGQRIIRLPKNIRLLQATDPICKQLYITYIGHYPNAKYHYFSRPRGISENILIYCVEGQGWIQYDGSTYTLSHDQAFILPADSKHSYGSNTAYPWSIYWFHFCGENTSMFNSIIGKIVHVNDSNNLSYNNRLLLFEEMYKNLEIEYNIENLEYVSFCLMHFMASLKYIDKFCGYDEYDKKEKGLDVIQKTILFMKNHLGDKITIEDITNHVGYSTDHFRMLFQKRTSLTPMEYYRYLKIQKACVYLEDYKGWNIKDIAFKLGYSDPFHFSRAFKQEMDVTPKEYRKRHMKK